MPKDDEFSAGFSDYSFLLFYYINIQIFKNESRWKMSQLYKLITAIVK